MSAGWIPGQKPRVQSAKGIQLVYAVDLSNEVLDLSPKGAVVVSHVLR